MIYGVGTDLVSLECIARPNKKFGMSFAERTFSPEGLLKLSQVGKPINYLAKRFAAKEAFAKAVDAGIRGAVTFCNVGVGHDALDKPKFFYAVPLAQRLKEQGIAWVHLSMSDEKDIVSTFAVAEREVV